MKKQIAVVAHIHTAALVEIVHMALECLALKEIGAQIVDDVPLLLRQFVAVCAVVNRREVGAIELHAPSVVQCNAG